MRKSELKLVKGSPDMPACVFVHGLGMTMHTWTDMESARTVGGLFPYSMLLRDSLGQRTLFHDMASLGYTTAAWSQPRPMGPAEIAIGELADIIGIVRKVPHNGIVLVGHSRGGLIARKYAEQTSGSGVRALVTLASPHRGSNMALWALRLGALGSPVRSMMDGRKREVSSAAIKRLRDFLDSRAVQELLPGSDFLKNLDDNKPGGVYCLSASGTDPTLLRLPIPVSLPGDLHKLLPDRLASDEILDGMGDGLVSSKSAVLPYADEHREFRVNHAEIIVDREVREFVAGRLAQALGG